MTDPAASLRAFRRFPHPPAKLYEAFADAALLARWWGPRGFTNTFQRFEFVEGGAWRFVMHGPDGTDYDNECRFVALEPGRRVLLEHVVPPWFTLEVTLAAVDDGTELTWVQSFESAEVARKIAAAIGDANDQNLERLAALLDGR